MTEVVDIDNQQDIAYNIRKAVDNLHKKVNLYNYELVVLKS